MPLHWLVHSPLFAATCRNPSSEGVYWQLTYLENMLLDLYLQRPHCLLRLKVYLVLSCWPSGVILAPHYLPTSLACILLMAWDIPDLGMFSQMLSSAPVHMCVCVCIESLLITKQAVTQTIGATLL